MTRSEFIRRILGSALAVVGFKAISSRVKDDISIELSTKSGTRYSNRSGYVLWRDGGGDLHREYFSYSAGSDEVQEICKIPDNGTVLGIEQICEYSIKM